MVMTCASDVGDVRTPANKRLQTSLRIFKLLGHEIIRQLIPDLEYLYIKSAFVLGRAKVKVWGAGRSLATCDNFESQLI